MSRPFTASQRPVEADPLPTTEEKLVSYLKRVTGELHLTRERLRAAESARHDPIAIVAMSCRLPGGVRAPEDLWRLVSAGTDAISAFPADRGWDIEGLYDSDPGQTGASYTTQGGFLDQAADFDPGFFGISPREALAIDPQQRLLLETSWEVLERAGLLPASMYGSRTAVFVGVVGQDYGPRLHEGSRDGDGYLLTGTTTSVASGRIAYQLGLEGPAVTVDTACSSSLVAIHLACRSLRQGECSLALAGGATVMASPGMFVEFSRQRGLAPDGRCKSFGAAADGTGWAEGAGMLLLERLADARRNGHPVLAVIRGTAVNSDGTSNGLTAPNGLAQQRVIREALADGQLSAADVDAVEAHGTGTTLGDPVEAEAVLATYGQRRDGDPLWLGSLKSNIGHTQAAAGVAGVIKMVLALRHQVLPRTLHADVPTPHVNWSADQVRLLTQAVPWPESGRPRRAAVSAFGISGTNAHVIVEAAAAPDGSAAAGAPPPAVPWVVSARSPQALRDQAQNLLSRFDGEQADRADVGFSLATTRSAFEYRAVILPHQPADLRAGLAALAAGQRHDALTQGVARPGLGTVFVFPGQGSQWHGMARELLADSAVFRDALRSCADALAPFVDWRLLDVLSAHPDSDASALERVDVVQPALFAVMVALTELWRAHGIQPAAVIGHSQGEIAAACAAGGLTLDDAARVVAARSRLLREIAGRGGMLSVRWPPEEVTPLLTHWGGALAVAAVNSPRSVIVSGDLAALGELRDRLSAQGVQTRQIPVDYAAHSAQVEEIGDALRMELAGLAPKTGHVPFWSTVTGGWLDTAQLDAGYWQRNLREPVRFADSVREVRAQAPRAFAEVSTHPVLTTAIQEICDADGAEDAVVTGSLRRGDGSMLAFLRSVAELHVHGAAADWGAVFAGSPRRRIELPTYPFQRQRYWLPATPAAPGRRDHALAESWRYRVEWQPLAEPGQMPATALAGRWLLVLPGGADSGDLVELAREALACRGAEVMTVEVPAGETGREALAARLRGESSGWALRGVLSLLATDERPHEASPVLSAGLVQTMALVQALGDAHIDAPLWCLTRNAVAAGDEASPVSPAQAAVWGLGRVAALEHPRRWGGLIDLPGAPGDETTASLGAVLAAGNGEDQFAIRSTGVFARRLVRAPLEVARGTRAWRPRGTVLVTGGTGALGRQAARWLAAHGAERVVLVSRRGDAQAVAALRSELGEHGTLVTAEACDVADRDAVADLIRRVRRGGLPIRTVVHAAGVGRLAPLDEASPDGLAEVAAGKVGGAWYMLDLLKAEDLDAVILFSSISSVWGVAGHGEYAAANACLDALAQRYRSAGVPVLSVAWGPWAGGGMIAASDRAGLRRRGVPLITAGTALAALEQALNHDETAIAIADVDWDRFVPVFTAVRPSRLFDEIPEVRRSLEAAGGPEPAGLSRRLAGLPGAEQNRLVLELVRTEAAAVLGHPGPDAIPPDRAFSDLGFDSLTAVELRNRLSAAIGMRLPATLAFDYPHARALAARVGAAAVGRDAPSGVGEPVPAGPSSFSGGEEPIAIVAMSCRYPGDVESPEDLWRVVVAGGDVISAFPADRGWPADGRYDPDPGQPGRTYVREGGFLHGAAEFDAELFGINPREAAAMDPQQRVLLEIAWEALERAQISPASLRGSRTGVFVGMGQQDYVARLRDSPGPSDGYLATGGAASVASGRVAYALGLEGPALTVDTACSSSLVAIHLAVRALRGNECGLALAAGVTVMSGLDSFIAFSRQRALARDARCKAFSSRADGFALSEGAGMLALERLSDARRNGHPVLAVIRGSAVNSDGASNGLTAPNGPAQQRVIRQALASAGLGPCDVDAVEAHGTGTALGDPIEAQALLAAYGQDRAADRPLWLGSVKSNIGHTQAACGVAGVIKMVMAMRHELLPRTLYAEEPSPQVDWSAGRVSLLTEPVPWPPAARRRAGVSSFGISGTNAHLILEDVSEEPGVADMPEPPATGGSAGPDVAWVLSAAGPAGLRAQAARLGAHVSERQELDIASVGYSLAITRAALEYRGTIIGRSRAELLRGCELLAAGTAAPNIIRGRADLPASVVFMFPGQGSQWPGMGVELLDNSPVFREHLHECAEALAPHTGWWLPDILRGAAGTPPLERVDVVQPALFAVMVSLAALWRSFGITPDAVVGHSQGEIAAAQVAGALSLSDAARAVALRSQVLRQVAGKSGMLSVSLSADRVAEILRRWHGEITIAAVNGPRSVGVAGEQHALEELAALCERDGVRARPIAIDYASHSAHVEPLRDEVLAAFEGIRPHATDIAFYSAVTGGRLDSGALDAGYWYRNLRQPIQFEPAVKALLEREHRMFIEVSPHPLLTAHVSEIAAAASRPVAVTGSLRRGQGAFRQFLTSAAEVQARVTAVEWDGVFGRDRARRVELPTYAFQRRRHWLDQPAQTASALAVGPAAADRRTYRVQWRPVNGPGSARPSGRWLVAVPAGQPGDDTVTSITDALRRGGAEVIALTVPRDASRAAVTRSLREAAADRAVSGTLSLLALDEDPHPAYPVLPAGAAATVLLIQALSDSGFTAPLWLVTRGAVGVRPSESPSAPSQAQVWGLGLTASLEHPQWRGGLLDLPATLDDRSLALVTRALAGAGEEDQLAVRPSGLFARRLTLVEPTAATGGRGWRPEGTVLVTGGTGELGRHLARWLAANGASQVILASRRGGAAPGVAALKRELPGRVTAAECDVTDPGALTRLVASLQGQRLSAIVHAAGAGQAGRPLAEMDLATHAEIAAAKVAGAACIDALPDDRVPDTVVLYSSAAGVLGSGGQGGYAAANAYLDALAARWRARGRTALSVAWGLWSGASVGGHLERHGMLPLQPEAALAALGHALRGSEPSLVIADIDWHRFAPVYAMARRRPLLDEIPEVREALAAAAEAEGPSNDTAGENGTSLAGSLAGLATAERRRALLDLVRSRAASVLGYDDADDVEAERAFVDLGLDSVTAIELRNRLAAATGLRLAATLAFDYPNATALAGQLEAELVPQAAGTAELVLEEISHLETRMSELAADDTRHDQISARLTALLSSWEARRTAPDPDGAAENLSSATDDELFELVDRQLGISPNHGR